MHEQDLSSLHLTSPQQQERRELMLEDLWVKQDNWGRLRAETNVLSIIYLQGYGRTWTIATMIPNNQ